MNTAIISVISVCIAGMSCLFVIINFVTGRKDKGSSQMDSMKESLLKLNMKTDQICATTNETRTDIKAMQKTINDLDKEIEVVKRDLQTAFIRIDELREKVNDNER